MKAGLRLFWHGFRAFGFLRLKSFRLYVANNTFRNAVEISQSSHRTPQFSYLDFHKDPSNNSISYVKVFFASIDNLVKFEMLLRFSLVAFDLFDAFDTVALKWNSNFCQSTIPIKHVSYVSILYIIHTCVVHCFFCHDHELHTCCATIVFMSYLCILLVSPA